MRPKKRFSLLLRQLVLLYLTQVIAMRVPLDVAYGGMRGAKRQSSNENTVPW